MTMYYEMCTRLFQPTTIKLNNTKTKTNTKVIYLKTQNKFRFYLY